MAVSYILDKDEFTILFGLINGADVNVPAGFFDERADENAENVLDGLARKGYIYKTETRIDIERTISFLIKQSAVCRRVISEMEGSRLIMYCPKLIVVLEEDRFSDKKCRITPIRDEEMLNEFLLENGSDNKESGDEE